ncbi:MAG: hypothetical protein OHK0012_13990 [Synechococcales cyanobacterium]
MGSFFALDTDGYVINPCELGLITSPWQDLVVALRQSCVSQLGASLHSLYLRGSVARGRGILGVSDLDAVAVLNLEPGSLQPDFLPLRQALQRTFPWCQGIEILGIPLATVWDPPVAALLKTQALCLAGMDLRPQLPPVKPGLALVTHAWTLRRDLQQVLAEWRQMSQIPPPSLTQRVRRRCGWLARRMVRSGFELVMERENTFTRDLYPCYAVFAKYYPQQERSMAKALELAIMPSANRAGLVVFVQQWGRWLVTEIDRVLAAPGGD